MIIRVPRKVREVVREGWVEPRNSLSLDCFQDDRAWVLLGEPGMGKTIAFELEAGRVSGKFLRVVEFLEDEVELRDENQPIFLDGLDEIRGDGNKSSLLVRVRKKLKELGNPPFRISCRGADWHGTTDSDDLISNTSYGVLKELLLEPLSEEDIVEVLECNHEIDDASQFVSQAKKNDVYGLLNNPEMLRLVATAVSDDAWPKSKNDTFALATRQLAKEQNKKHKVENPFANANIEGVVDAAGHLCAVLLLSDTLGVSLEPKSGVRQYPSVESIFIPDTNQAFRAVQSKLFRLEPTCVDSFIPCHRTIAEYLASCWLAKQVEMNGMPLRRLLNILLGNDGKTVSGLRGLYGWLALHCIKVSNTLIRTDPLTIVVYGDVASMNLEAKRQILLSLRDNIISNPSYRGDHYLEPSFGSLSEPGLDGDIFEFLSSQSRTRGNQEFVYCIMDILFYGDAHLNYRFQLIEIVRDEKWWPGIRQRALKVWLKVETDALEKIDLLKEIEKGEVSDSDDQLEGMLLMHLYPENILSEDILQYLHPVKQTSLYGEYSHFWGVCLAENTLSEKLGIVLDSIIAKGNLDLQDPYERHVNRFIDKILKKAIYECGDDVHAERLYAWLETGCDMHDGSVLETDTRQEIAVWLTQRPDIYKALLALCFADCGNSESIWFCVRQNISRLQGARVPEDIGLWHLNMATETENDEVAQLHLDYSVKALFYNEGREGLSLEVFEAWAVNSSKRWEWLQPLLQSTVDDRMMKDAIREKDRKQKRIDDRRSRTKEVTQYLHAIKNGSAPPGLYDQLAGVWLGNYSDILGETVEERFNDFVDNGNDLVSVAREGFLQCLGREDLPDAEEIVKIGLEQRNHYICKPCLVGVELLYQKSSLELLNLRDEVLASVVSFYLVTLQESTPKWFYFLVERKTSVVAPAVGHYLSSNIKAKKEHIQFLYALCNDDGFKSLAVSVVPGLLKSYPVRVTLNNLGDLEYLLKVALRYSLVELEGLIEEKLAKRGMDKPQKIYWYVAACLFDPEKYEDLMWKYIKNSEVYAKHVSDFLGDRQFKFYNEKALPEKTLGKLIELLVPTADFNWESQSGWVTDEMSRGDRVRSMVANLGSLTTNEAQFELERLLGVPGMERVVNFVERALNDLKIRKRDQCFSFLTPSQISNIIVNKKPESNADLMALVLDLLDDIEREIQTENDDGYNGFWNIARGKESTKREENLCRDVLLTRIRSRLNLIRVCSEPEVDNAGDKRADITITSDNYQIPIELKKETSSNLWVSLRSQLIDQYSTSKKAQGFGIYLVLWFDGKGMPRTIDGRKKPRGPDELKTVLEDQIAPDERSRIYVVVMDVGLYK